MQHELKLFNPNTQKVDGYSEMNRKWVAGLKRLLEAAKNGPPDEDPIILFPDREGQEGQNLK